MSELTERQQGVFKAVVREYSRFGIPVSSKVIAERYMEDICPATIRAELAELERIGVLCQPHTSSGRMPTDLGYRHFVNTLMERESLSYNEEQELIQAINRVRRRHLQTAKALALVLAERTHNVAITGEFLHHQKQTYDTGLKSLMNLPEFHNKSDQLAEVVGLVEELDENVEELMEIHQPQRAVISIGDDGFFRTPTRECSVVFSSFENRENGARGIIAIVGPKRMPYERNVTLVEHLSSIIGHGLPAVIILSFIIGS